MVEMTLLITAATLLVIAIRQLLTR